MPSAFEPGGIVQHEFFISGTPVIAFRTGGLKDTVVEFVPATGEGNARRSVVSCEASSWAWLCEFARLRNKMPLNANKVEEIYNSLPEWSEAAWRRRKEQLAAAAIGGAVPPGGGWGTEAQQQQQQQLLLQQQAEAAAEFWALPTSTASKRRRRSKLRTHPSSSSSSSSSSGREEETTVSMVSDSSRRSSADNTVAPKPTSQAARPKNLIPATIKYIPPAGKPRPRSVAAAGSFDDWRVRRPLAWDNAIQAFAISLALPPGEYTYKLVVEGEWVCCHGSPTIRDAGGNENNVLIVE
ncbi:hypothetical protein Emag_003749 [Eimeria magna]